MKATVYQLHRQLTVFSLPPLQVRQWSGQTVHCFRPLRVSRLTHIGYTHLCSQHSVPPSRGVSFATVDHIPFAFSFSFSSRWHRSARKGPYALRPVSQQSPQSCPRNSANICLVEHRSFSAFEGGISAASFLHSSFL